MSLKIYNGFYLNLEHDIGSVYSFLESFRKTLPPLIEKRHAEYVIEKALTEYDTRTIAPHLAMGGPSSCLELSQKYFKEIFEKQEESGHLEIDYSCSISLYPVSYRILAIIKASEKSLVEIFSSLPEVSSFNYWDNSDPDPLISVEDWKRRGSLWGEALKDRNPGLTFEAYSRICPSPSRSSFSEVLSSYCPDKRVKSVAKNLVTSEFIENEKDSPHLNIFNYFISSQFLEEVSQRTEQIRPLLNLNITLEDLES